MSTQWSKTGQQRSFVKTSSADEAVNVEGAFQRYGEIEAGTGT